MAPKSVLKFIPRSTITDPSMLPGAACRGIENPDLFFEEETVAEAKAVCASCPLQAQCLSFATEQIEYGVWGGATAEERNQIRGTKFFSREERDRSVQAENFISQGMTLEAIAARFDCSVRTVYRFRDAREAWLTNQAA